MYVPFINNVISKETEKANIFSFFYLKTNQNFDLASIIYKIKKKETRNFQTPIPLLQFSF